MKIYQNYLKRPLDFLLSTIGIILLSPVIIIFTVLGYFIMKGNPFFFQERPGKNGRIFKMVKFRTMNNKKDENGILLPDLKRLTAYGRFLRKSSIDELPELFNILKGEMSIVGPRPLLVKYLPLYNDHQMRRHEVRPGLTGLAQIKGRNSSSWNERFDLDIEYVDNITFVGDLKIFFGTFVSVFKKEGIDSNESTTVTRKEFAGSEDN